MLGPELTPPRRRVVLPMLCGVLQSPLRRLRRVALATHIAATAPRIRRSAMTGLTPAAILVVAATAVSARQAPRLPRNCATLRPAPHHLPALNAGNIGLTDHANLRASKRPHHRDGAKSVRTCLATNRVMHICAPEGHLWKVAVNMALCREVRSRGGGDRLPPGGALTWGDALVGAGVLSGHRHCSMHGHALRAPRYACLHHSMLVPGSIVLGCGTVRLRPLPFRWLHHRQITVVLPSVSVPPLL